MAARGTLLAFTRDLSRTLRRLRKNLEMCDAGDGVEISAASVTSTANMQRKQHVLQVQDALDTLLSRPFPSSKNLCFNIQTIRDDFFTDYNGNIVEDADYAFVQLAGPDGPLLSNTVRFGLSYQAPGLSYLGHYHIARELYVVLEGSSLWWTDSAPKWVNQTTSFHMEEENHAMRTLELPALYFWSWSGDLTMDIKLSESKVQRRLII